MKRRHFEYRPHRPRISCRLLAACLTSSLAAPQTLVESLAYADCPDQADVAPPGAEPVDQMTQNTGPVVRPYLDQSDNSCVQPSEAETKSVEALMVLYRNESPQLAAGLITVEQFNQDLNRKRDEEAKGLPAGASQRLQAGLYARVMEDKANALARGGSPIAGKAPEPVATDANLSVPGLNDFYRSLKVYSDEIKKDASLLKGVGKYAYADLASGSNLVLKSPTLSIYRQRVADRANTVIKLLSSVQFVKKGEENNPQAAQAQAYVQMLISEIKGATSAVMAQESMLQKDADEGVQNILLAGETVLAAGVVASAFLSGGLTAGALPMIATSGFLGAGIGGLISSAKTASKAWCGQKEGEALFCKLAQQAREGHEQYIKFAAYGGAAGAVIPSILVVAGAAAGESTVMLATKGLTAYGVASGSYSASSSATKGFLSKSGYDTSWGNPCDHFTEALITTVVTATGLKGVQKLSGTKTRTTAIPFEKGQSPEELAAAYAKREIPEHWKADRAPGSSGDGGGAAGGEVPRPGGPGKLKAADARETTPSEPEPLKALAARREVPAAENGQTPPKPEPVPAPPVATKPTPAEDTSYFELPSGRLVRVAVTNRKGGVGVSEDATIRPIGPDVGDPEVQAFFPRGVRRVTDGHEGTFVHNGSPAIKKWVTVKTTDGKKISGWVTKVAGRNQDSPQITVEGAQGKAAGNQIESVPYDKYHPEQVDHTVRYTSINGKKTMVYVDSSRRVPVTAADGSPEYRYEWVVTDLRNNLRYTVGEPEMSINQSR